MKTRSMLRMTVLAAGALFALSLAGPASAQRADDMKGGGGNPCVGDAQKICSEFIPDRSKVASCLFKNKSKLTPACRAELSGGSKATSGSRKGKRSGKRSRRR